jgi:hypothetical protein
MNQEADAIDADQVAASSTQARRVERAEALVNAVSGLANDFLNIYFEIVMLIEQLPVMPELIDDIIKWHPISYQDYFTSSALPGRAAAIETYKALDPRFRTQFEAVLAELDSKAVGTVAAIRHINKARRSAAIESIETLCARSTEAMRETLDKATNLVNYGSSTSQHSAQARADRLFGAARRSA